MTHQMKGTCTLNPFDENLGEGVGRRSDCAVVLNPLQTSNIAVNPPTSRCQQRYNRWFLLVVYIFVDLLTSWVFFGWSSLAALFFADGQYRWLCTEEEVDLGVFSRRCDAQDVAVQRLFTCSLVGHLVGVALTGLILDLTSPKITGLMGGILGVIGWGSATLATESFQILPLSWFLVGFACDLIYLPTLKLSVLFPKHENTVVAIIGGASTASPFVPSMFYFIKKFNPGVSIKMIFFIYAFVGPGLAAFLAAFCFPPKKHFQKDSQATPETSLKSPSTKVTSLEEDTGYITTGVEMAEVHSPHSVRAPVAPKLTWWKKAVHASKEIFAQARSIKFIMVGVLYSVLMLSADAIYQPTAVRVMPVRALEALNIVIPLSLIPCIIFGKIADIIGVIPILSLVAGCGAVSFLFITIGSTGAYFISVVTYSIFISFIETGIYCFIQSTTPESRVGRMYGLAVMFGNTSAVLSNYIYQKVGLELLGGEFTYLLVAYTVILATLSGMFLLFHLLKKDKLTGSKALPEALPGESVDAKAEKLKYMEDGGH